jgi:CysZ protein
MLGPMTASPVPELGAKPRLSDFVVGLSLPWRAAGLMRATPRLRRLSLIASAVTLVTLTALVVVLAWYTGDLVAYVAFEPQGLAGKVGFFLLSAATFVLLFVVGANTLPLLALAAMQDALSEAAEEACGDFTAPPFGVGSALRGAAVSLGHTLARIGFLLVGHALLFALHLLPAVGSALWTVASILWTMVWLAAEYLDAPMARHLYPFRQVRGALRARPLVALGFGAAVYALLWIPVVNLFFVPLATVAGTLMFRALRACAALPPAASPAP